MILDGIRRRSSDYYSAVCSKNKPALFGLVLSVLPFFVYAGLAAVSILLTYPSLYEGRYTSDTYSFFGSSLVFFVAVSLVMAAYVSMLLGFVLSIVGLAKAYKGAPLRVVALLGAGISSLQLLLPFLLAVAI